MLTGLEKSFPLSKWLSPSVTKMIFKWGACWWPHVTQKTNQLFDNREVYFFNNAFMSLLPFTDLFIVLQISIWVHLESKTGEIKSYLHLLQQYIDMSVFQKILLYFYFQLVLYINSLCVYKRMTHVFFL